MKFSPHEYQQKAITHAVENQHSFQILDLGMGKTVITLSALSELLDRMEATRVLIFGTKRIIYSVWEQEAAKWDHTRHLYFVNLHKEGIENGLGIDGDIYLLNYENVQKLVDILIENKWQDFFDVVVYDEITKMKNPKSKRFKAWKKQLRFIDRRIGLTATPAPNGMFDLFAQTFCIDGGKHLGKFSTHFRQRFFYQADYFGYKFELMPGAKEKIYELIAPLVVRMDAKDYLKLPDLVFNPVYVDLPEGVMKQYKELEREFLLELENGEEIVASTAASLGAKLHQFVQGAVYTNPEDKSTYSILHNEKVEALKDMLEELQGKPTLIAYWFKHDLERLRGPSAPFKEAPYIGGGQSDQDANTAITAWQKGKLDILFAQPATAAHGLNLQSSGNNLIFFTLNWNLELHQQLIGRLYRQGQKHETVFVHAIIARGTIDEVIWEQVQNKADTQQHLLDALKKYQADALKKLA